MIPRRWLPVAVPTTLRATTAASAYFSAIRPASSSASSTFTMEALVSLCKRTGYVYPSSEVYTRQGGHAGFFDFGPLGVEMRRNLKQLWWRDMVLRRDDIVGLDSTIIGSPAIWRASGHVDEFTDPMVDCRESRVRLRADHVLFGEVMLQDGGGGGGASDDSVDSDGGRNILGYVSVMAGEAGDAALPADVAAKKAKRLRKSLGETGRLAPVVLRRLVEATPEEYPLVPSPVTDAAMEGGALTAVRDFNLLFETRIGAMVDSASTAYLRPETAQGIFTNFANVQRSSRLKLPFGIAQIGKAFRNEITPRNFLFRSREFEQMELEYFVEPPCATSASSAGVGGGDGSDGGDGGIRDGDGTGDGTAAAAAATAEEAKGKTEGNTGEATEEAWQASHAEWVKSRHTWLVEAVGLKPDLLSLDVQGPDDRAHYALACTDILFRFPFGEQELEGVAARGDYDLRKHQEHSGQSLGDLYDDSAGDARLPFTIEPSLGVDRLMLAVLCSAYEEETLAPTGSTEADDVRTGEGGGKETQGKKKKKKQQQKKVDTRTVLRLHPHVAPLKAAVFPLVKNNPEIVAFARDVLGSMKGRHGLHIGWDEAGAIGRRYRRMDEVGTPYCITVDHQVRPGR